MNELEAVAKLKEIREMINQLHKKERAIRDALIKRYGNVHTFVGENILDISSGVVTSTDMPRLKRDWPRIDWDSYTRKLDYFTVRVY